MHKPLFQSAAIACICRNGADMGKKITALYSRLSRDDDAQGDSNSIKHQKAMLEDYAAKNGFKNAVHFSDDGYSGGTFERPDWKRLVDEIDAGNVETVLTKDLSRIGRDYLQTGFYTEVHFREKGVRFIAIANNIDSANRDSGEFAPFLNIMSEWYIRDCSRKVKNVLRANGLAGKRLTPSPIYGYQLDPNDKTKWVIDEEPAAIVRRIFQMTIDGKGPTDIARIFCKEKIVRPMHYLDSHGISKNQRVQPELTYSWNGGSVAAIIAKPEYKGNTVNFRTSKESYKDKRARKTSPDEWVIFENTHAPIIDDSTWELAQKCRGTKCRHDLLGNANPLTGLVYCADCGARMYNHRRSPKDGEAAMNTEEYYRRSDNSYNCSTNNKTRIQFAEKCSPHWIQTAVLREMALMAIQTACAHVWESEADFIRQVREKSVVRQEETAKSHRKKIAKHERRILELNGLIKRLYEDMVAGTLSQKRFETLTADYEREQTELEHAVLQLKSELESYKSDADRAGKFIEIVKRHTAITELTPTIIAEFIEKIVVHEADKSSGEREQEIEVYLNLVGKIEIPVSEPTQEEIIAEEKARDDRVRNREKATRHRAKKKAGKDNNTKKTNDPAA